MNQAQLALRLIVHPLIYVYIIHSNQICFDISIFSRKRKLRQYVVESPYSIDFKRFTHKFINRKRQGTF